MTTCAQCGEPMERYGNAEPKHIFGGVFLVAPSFDIGVCNKPDCPNFNLLQRYSDEN